MKFKDIPRGLLIVLFCYAALSKLLDYGAFQHQMLNQVFRPWFDQALVYLVPLAEIAAVALLMTKRSGYGGLWLSFVLLLSFTGYICLVLLHFWKRVPCSCGGVLGRLSWGPHLVFNGLFLLIAILGIVLERRERRHADGAVG